MNNGCFIPQISAGAMIENGLNFGEHTERDLFGRFGANFKTGWTVYFPKHIFRNIHSIAAQVVDHLTRFGTLTYWRVLPPRVQDLNLALMAFYSTAGEAAAAIAGLKNLPVGDDGPL